MTFAPLPATIAFTPDPTGCPAGFLGTLRFAARLTNISEHALRALVVTVTTLTRGALLQNAASGPGGVGARLPVPEVAGFRDGILTPEEGVDVPFVLCVMDQEPFRFEVDVVGVVAEGEGF